MPTNVWHLTINLSSVWRSEIPVTEKVAIIVAAFKASGWRELTPYPDTFDDMLAELGDAEDVAEFDGAFAEFYDLADSDRVWIETH